MKNTIYKMRLSDFLLINIPAALFSALAFISILFRESLSCVPNFVFYIISWWATCGMVMILVDYRRKRHKFRRLLEISSDGVANYPKKLLSTICGACLVLALLHRVRTMRVYNGGLNEKKI